MKLSRFPMGCFSSRSTIAPTDSAENITATSVKTRTPANGQANGSTVTNGNLAETIRDDTSINLAGGKSFNSSLANNSKRQMRDKTESLNSSIEVPDDDIMSILISSQEKSSEQENMQLSIKAGEEPRSALHEELERDRKEAITNLNNQSNKTKSTGSAEKSNTGGSFDEEPNLELLRQYIAIDYEIAQLEDKDALRVYHEKIEQLEQLERELDMIGSEAEEVAVRNESGSAQLSDRFELQAGPGSIQLMDSKADGENNSILSDATNSMSHKSWLADPINATNSVRRQKKGTSKTGGRTPVSVSATNTNNSKINRAAMESGSVAGTGRQTNRSRRTNNNDNSGGNLPYSTIEEVFNRKIILEKERDKLKKEVEIVIVECDKLQQRYKKRDEILDKLFDGRTGGGLENHLEQQLNWLLEQKHYVDQVFYAWKRAETLTSQTCEQFASALELLKRLPKVEEAELRVELANNIGQLLIKSRQDMEQAQKYNPNVDAPFFTENETERFDRIIDIISSNNNSGSTITSAGPKSSAMVAASGEASFNLISTDNSTINPLAYSQVLTVIQFAYKRAVSIRLWLEQILQTTIARDTFELAEEYKWIAIQLRKERINLIKLKLQEAPYQAMVQSVKEQMERQQSLVDTRRQHEINRDSGVESETNDIDIEEEIYRLLELNKWRLEAAAAPPATAQQTIRPMAAITSPSTTSVGADKSKAVPSLVGQQPVRTATAAVGNANLTYNSSWRDFNNADLALAQVKHPTATLDRNVPSAGNDLASINTKTSSQSGFTMPTKLKIELDEELRQSLLRQVDQIHAQHRSKLDKLRDNNMALATNSMSNRMQLAKQQQSQQPKQRQARPGSSKKDSSEALAAK